jgi:hypothetical protein
MTCRHAKLSLIHYSKAIRLIFSWTACATDLRFLSLLVLQITASVTIKVTSKPTWKRDVIYVTASNGWLHDCITTMFGQKTRPNINIESLVCKRVVPQMETTWPHTMSTGRSRDGLTSYVAVSNMNNRGHIKMKTISSPDIYSSCNLACVSTTHHGTMLLAQSLRDIQGVAKRTSQGIWRKGPSCSS